MGDADLAWPSHLGEAQASLAGQHVPGQSSVHTHVHTFVKLLLHVGVDQCCCVAVTKGVSMETDSMVGCFCAKLFALCSSLMNQVLIEFALSQVLLIINLSFHHVATQM